MNDLVTTAELCAEKGITPSAVSQAVSSGRLTPLTKLPGVRGAFLFTRETADAFKAGAK